MNAQVWIGDDEPQPDNVEPIQNLDAHIKPRGGIWTSTLTNTDPVSSAWTEWCHSNHYWTVDTPKAWLLFPDPDADVYTVDDMADLRALTHEYGIELSPGLATLDYEAIAQTYDGLHVTSAGQSMARLTRLGTPDLVGWDCESTLWFDWAFTNVEYAGTVDAHPNKNKF